MFQGRLESLNGSSSLNYVPEEQKKHSSLSNTLNLFTSCFWSLKFVVRIFGPSIHDRDCNLSFFLEKEDSNLKIVFWKNNRFVSGNVK